MLKGQKLAQWDDFRTIDWFQFIDSPDLVIEQTRQLLSI